MDQIHIPAPLPWSRVPWKRPWRGQLQSMPQGATLRPAPSPLPWAGSEESFEQPWSPALPWRNSWVMFINHSITRAPVSHCCGDNRGSGGEEGASPDLRGSFLVTGQQGSEKHWASPGEYLTTCYESSHVPQKFTCQSPNPWDHRIRLVFIRLRMISFQDFPGSPVVKTLYFQQRGSNFDPSLVTKHKLKESVTVGLSYPGACGILVHRAGIKSTSHTLVGRFLTTRPPRKSQGRSILNADTYHRITPERLHSCVFLASIFPDGSGGKNLPANTGDASLIPGLGRSPGEGNGNPLIFLPEESNGQS